jgi:hypothetical protein
MRTEVVSTGRWRSTHHHPAQWGQYVAPGGGNVRPNRAVKADRALGVAPGAAAID